jgi:hypothetical protein
MASFLLNNTNSVGAAVRGEVNTIFGNFGAALSGFLQEQEDVPDYSTRPILPETEPLNCTHRWKWKCYYRQCRKRRKWSGNQY